MVWASAVGGSGRMASSCTVVHREAGRSGSDESNNLASHFLHEKEEPSHEEHLLLGHCFHRGQEVATLHVIQRRRGRGVKVNPRPLIGHGEDAAPGEPVGT